MAIYFNDIFFRTFLPCKQIRKFMHVRIVQLTPGVITSWKYEIS
jgi:hypothetical protein